jgi:hypothetical protein
MGKFKESARKTAEKISKGLTQNQHLGSHSFETLYQEIVSLGNTKPMFRDKEWYHKCRNARANIITGIAKGKRKYQQLILFLNSVEEMR